MSRKNIFDTLANKYKIDKELQRIAILFNEKIFLYRGSSQEYTIEQIADNFGFPFWKSRGSCLNCKDMKNSLGLVDNPKKIKNIDKVLDYLEYYINICNLVDKINEFTFISHISRR